MYCDGRCKHLDAKKHKCNLTGEKLAYMRGSGFIVHEHSGLCANDTDEKEN